VLVAVRHVPETRDPHASSHFDWWGAVLASLALGGTTYALIEWGGVSAVLAAVVAVVTAVGFVLVEGREAEPMLQLGLFRDRTFSASNAMTFLVYGALGAMGFFVTLQLQTVVGYGALAAGIAFLPMTLAMLFLASAGGRLATRIGPRLPMTVGPVVMGAATLLLMRVDADSGYWLDVFPGATLFGLGLSVMVAPLTATVLAAAPDEHAGIASGVNNAVARSGTLIAVAALPVAVGLGGEDYGDASAFDPAYGTAMLACAGLLVAGGLVSWLTIRNEVLALDGARPDE
jgi:predicted MFS family arabinose efflux permease